MFPQCTFSIPWVAAPMWLIIDFWQSWLTTIQVQRALSLQSQLRLSSLLALISPASLFTFPYLYQKAWVMRAEGWELKAISTLSYRRSRMLQLHPATLCSDSDDVSNRWQNQRAQSGILHVKGRQCSYSTQLSLIYLKGHQHDSRWMPVAYDLATVAGDLLYSDSYG